MAYVFDDEPDFLTQLVPDKPKYVFDEAPVQEAAKTQPNISKTESFISGAADTGSFGFGDELMASLMAPVEYAGSRALRAMGVQFPPEKDLSKMPLSAIYDMEKQGIVSRDKAASEANPWTHLAGQLAGGVGTAGAIGAGTKTGQALGNIVSRGLLPNATGRAGALANLATKAVTGAGVGAASSGLYGLGSGEDGKRLENAGQAAVYGAGFGGAAPVVGAAVGSLAKGVGNVAKGVAARGDDALETASRTLKAKSSQLYDAMRANGAVIKSDYANKIPQNIESKLLETGKLNAKLHGDTLSVIKDIKAATKKGDLGLEELDQYRQLLRDVVRKNTTKIDGSNPDAMKAQVAIDALDDMVEALEPSNLAKGDKSAVTLLNNARKEWGTYKKFDRIAQIVEKSEGDANYLKRELKKLSENPKLTAGYSKQELKALKEAGTLSTGEGILKMLGKFGIDFGGSRIGNTGLPVMSSLISAGTGNPVAAVGIPAAGTAARQLQKYVARGKAENLLKLIEGKQPLSLPQSALQRFGIAPSASVGQVGAEQRPLKLQITPADKRKTQ